MDHHKRATLRQGWQILTQAAQDAQVMYPGFRAGQVDAQRFYRVLDGFVQQLGARVHEDFPQKRRRKVYHLVMETACLYFPIWPDVVMDFLVGQLGRQAALERIRDYLGQYQTIEAWLVEEGPDWCTVECPARQEWTYRVVLNYPRPNLREYRRWNG